MNPLSKIHFTFTATSVNAALLSDYIASSHAALCERFELPADAVRVAHKLQLPEDAPFVLSCYGKNGKPDYPAMAVAARLVLPGLQNLAKTSESYYWQVSLWNPGESLDADIAATALIAKGYHRGLDGTNYIERPQREWLESKAVQFGVINSVDNFSNEELAHIVHAELSAQAEALAA